MTKPADHIVDIEIARELGMRLQKEYLINQAEFFCSKLVDSTAFHPDQKVTQGQVKSANQLLEYLRR